MECGGCTACCNVLQIDAIDKPMYTPCRYCDGGCSIHNSKPKTCAEFECAYYQAPTIPESLRPDRCGIIFMKKTDRIFSGLLVDGVEVSDMAKAQINSFLQQGFSVVLLCQDEYHWIPATGHDQKELDQEYKEHLSGNL